MMTTAWLRAFYDYGKILADKYYTSCNRFSCRETTMTIPTQEALEKGYEKLKNLPQKKMLLVLSMIDMLADSVESASSVKLGIADGKYHIPDDINEYDDEIADLFEVH